MNQLIELYDLIFTRLIKTIFNKGNDLVVLLSTEGIIQKHTLTATIPILTVWRQETMRVKFWSLLKLSWLPSENALKRHAKETFFREIFGKEEDFGYPLFDIFLWHSNREWILDNLTKKDEERAEALEALTVLTRIRYSKMNSPYLNLQLGKIAPMMCCLVYPMIVKIPVRSMQYFVDIHSAFAFNSIRKAKHESADSLIAYLYEIMFLQQKIAVSFHKFIVLIDSIKREKGNNILYSKEIEAILDTETIISYLKASFEKTIAFLGYIYNITDLDAKKDHIKKIRSLKSKVDQTVQKQEYFQIVIDILGTDSLEILNQYRTGILHKKGISELQPHNFTNNDESTMPLIVLFQNLHDEHVKNSIAIIGTLALLTDELVNLDFPNISQDELPKVELHKFCKEYIM